ncbi:MAG: osmoprotectant transport system ATP-binding protein [Frankiaceae bacterium]|nr:osmoprotectant transport system ATP-binding protein [Frankiaceae bacterium]
MNAIEEPMIRFVDVSKKYGTGAAAVDGVTLDVPRGSLVALVGPSGCGKTTTLKMVNRLIEPTSGQLLVDGQDVMTADVVALRRRIGYVIQSSGLFPHRTVADNVATVLTLLGWDARRRRARVLELLDLVGLDATTFATRYPHELSGGQRQRVGVARALAADPPLLLMDEPFAALDPLVRERLQVEFARLQRDLGKTVLFVTHDIEEAIRLGDHIAVMNAGHVEQYAAPDDLLAAPATEFVAEFLGGERALRRLGVTPVPLDGLVPLDGSAASLPRVAAGTSARGALSAMVAAGTDAAVIERDGADLGVLTMTAAAQAASSSR